MKILEADYLASLWAPVQGPRGLLPLIFEREPMPVMTPGWRPSPMAILTFDSHLRRRFLKRASHYIKFIFPEI